MSIGHNVTVLSHRCSSKRVLLRWVRRQEIQNHTGFTIAQCPDRLYGFFCTYLIAAQGHLLLPWNQPSGVSHAAVLQGGSMLLLSLVQFTGRSCHLGMKGQENWKLPFWSQIIHRWTRQYIHLPKPTRWAAVTLRSRDRMRQGSQGSCPRALVWASQSPFCRGSRLQGQEESSRESLSWGLRLEHRA